MGLSQPWALEDVDRISNWPDGMHMESGHCQGSLTCLLLLLLILAVALDFILEDRAFLCMMCASRIAVYTFFVLYLTKSLHVPRE